MAEDAHIYTTAVRLRERAMQILREDDLHQGTYHAIEIDAGIAAAREEAAEIIRDLLKGFERISSSDFMADEIDAASEWLQMSGTRTPPTHDPEDRKVKDA